MASVQDCNSTNGTVYSNISLDDIPSQVSSGYITKLKGGMGIIPKWFGQPVPNSDEYIFDGSQQQGSPGFGLCSDSTVSSRLQLNPEESSSFMSARGTIKESHGKHRPHFSEPGSTRWLNHYIPQESLYNTQGSFHGQHNIDALNRQLDISDETSQSYGSESARSKTLGTSPYTPAGTVSIKVEPDDVAILNGTREHSSRASSLSSQLSPAKSTTPAPLPEVFIEKVAPKRRRASNKVSRILFREFPPRTSIPSDIPHEELARQSVQAAYSSRLNPFALHPDEYQLLRDHICTSHVTAYINVRNRILRLWVRNPLVSVTAEEAAGCAYSSRWLGLAEVAYEWLVRKGYINFGCVEVPDASNIRDKKKKLKRTRKTIVVVGAGMAGLGCARQLEGLLSHYREKWTNIGEEPPRVIVLEGRARIGGRIYSHPLRGQSPIGLPSESRCTAEVGAHIITGFDHGNPLSMIIRGQLALHYYPLKDNSTLYDVDGKIVDRDRDKLVEKLFNDILDRASVYRHSTPSVSTAEGKRELIEIGKDPQDDTHEAISLSEEEKRLMADGPPNPRDEDLQPVPGGMDKLTGKAHMITGSRTKAHPAFAAEAMGWRLGSDTHQDLNLERVVKASQYPVLGAAMDEAVRQYQRLLDLSPQDMRLLNWHFANLEYANATNVSTLSLGGWDQDIGNEFEGEHAQVIGGYQQVPRGIWQYPSKLDLRTRKAVKRIEYDANSNTNTTAKILCEDGDFVEANHVVLTAPLGVLKNRSLNFKPQLPNWKLDAIQRLGFGVLNKVILVFERPFWLVDQDMVGLLRDSRNGDSLDQADYVQNRGRSYLFWNCIKTSGCPMLIALMAGDAAYQAEQLSDHQIVFEVTQQLARMYKQISVPQPLETIVTRWGKDRFAQGSYSYVGPTSQPGDYDAMARSVGNLHFAGEATCGTHPATVHGAYISGLRAASEVIDDLLGPIVIPTPLVPVAIKTEPSPIEPGQTASLGQPNVPVTSKLDQERLESFETEILKAIFAKLGSRPDKPAKAGANPFLLFSKDKWAECKAQCDEARRAALGNPNTKAPRNEVRVALGQMWREASEEMKKPYIHQTVNNRQSNHQSAASFQDTLAAWDAEAMSCRREYVKEHPGVLSKEEERRMWQALGVYGGTERRAKKMSGYADDSPSEMEV